MATTIKDVSDRAGVSVATVSRAFSAPERLKPKTLEKVLQAAAEVNFHPNANARSLRSKRAHTVLVMLPDIANPFFSNVVKGIEREASARGYAVLLGNTGGDVARTDDLARVLDSQQADGVVQLSAHIPASVRRRMDQGLPFAFVNACDCVDTDTVDRVMIDNRAAARSVILELATLGHTRIGVVEGPGDSLLTHRRRAGCLEAAAMRAGVALAFRAGDYSMKSGQAAALHLLGQPDAPTALFCFSDEMAVGALNAARQLGIPVPDALSIMGFDNLDHAELSVPGLSTVSQPKMRLGEMAMTLLTEQMSGPARAPRTITVEHALIWRGSTAPAPGS